MKLGILIEIGIERNILEKNHSDQKLLKMFHEFVLWICFRKIQGIGYKNIKEFRIKYKVFLILDK